MKIAVIAHSKKSVGGGLPALRAGLIQRGQPDVDWHEVSKSRKLPKALARALESGPDLVIVWGGDGMVQRAVDTLARKGAADVALAVIPAGTSNLFASNLGIAKDTAPSPIAPPARSPQVPRPRVPVPRPRSRSRAPAASLRDPMPRS
jgi:diacylglycerol kinase (ATP)